MASPGDAVAQRQRDEALAGAGRWLGAAIAIGPAFDVADKHGLLSTLTNPATFELAPAAWPLAMIGVFVGLAVAAARMLQSHGHRGRWVFFAACAVPLVGWMLHSGIRGATLIPPLALTMSGFALRSVERPR